MKIVIDIHEEDYEIMKHNVAVGNPLCPIGQEEMVNKVVNGTPLPKGHGRLIEVNKLLNMTKSYKSELGGLKADPFVESGIETVERFIKEMSPIIEADTGSEEQE